MTMHAEVAGNVTVVSDEGVSDGECVVRSGSTVVYSGSLWKAPSEVSGMVMSLSPSDFRVLVRNSERRMLN